MGVERRTINAGLARARDLAKRGETGAAHAQFAALAALEPDNTAVLAGLAHAEGALGNWDAARRSWQRCLQLAPAPAPIGWHMGLLRAAAALRDIPATRGCAAALIAAHPHHAPARQVLVRLLIEARDLAALAEELSGGSLAMSGDADALMVRLRAQIFLQTYANARGTILKMVPLIRSAALLHKVFDLAAICFGRSALAQVWESIEVSLQRLEPQHGEGALHAHTLALRLLIARRELGQFARAWTEGRAVLPAWQLRFELLSLRLLAEGRQRRKVFGIGLSKTGTTSLAAALEQLGWLTAHYRNPFDNAILQPDDFDLFDAANDEPVACLFETLYAEYPNALFICTVRPLESWAESVRSHRRRARGADEKWDIERFAIEDGPEGPWPGQQFTYKTIWKDKEIEEAYRAWDARVRGFFADKPGKLLMFDVFNGEGWPELCRFLGCAVPDGVAFPHANHGAREDE